MSDKQNLYAERDVMQLDKDGNFYCQHVSAMTREGLHFKSDIAAELGFRDSQIDRLEQENAELREALKQLVSSSEENEKQLNDLLMCNDYGESEALCKAKQLLNK